MEYEKVNVTLPKDTLLKLRRLVPPGKRSHIIAEATARYLEEHTQKAALQQATGLWKDRRFRTQADVNRFLKRLRGSTRRAARASPPGPLSA